MIDSPPPHLAAPNVLPVVTKSDVPSDATPPGAHTPPPRAFVRQARTAPGSATGMPTTQPW